MRISVLYLYEFIYYDRQKLKNDASLIPNMVSEIIRYQTPLMHMRRTATKDVILGGQQIHKGDKVVMWYASGMHVTKIIRNHQLFCGS